MASSNWEIDKNNLELSADDSKWGLPATREATLCLVYCADAGMEIKKLSLDLPVTVRFTLHSLTVGDDDANQ
jgi:hypothetical protein